ncbi:alpha/beta fold hydrolase [Kribbella sandramycini]|uniref:Alpha/beta fold hydrolase n=1 Tax=Kribbella sandramycini TaxID=60450 RepID=A0A7Y4KWG1_9ACTN|nr:alpha/beta fold hydrolase [Kribbella sandramycini]MBB6567546.1 pimeloyl-ACP methyl ester carboxylesterase [Kribbella sandramycini]NOL39850.1 alpha/beta fold hydrolase [Kribbella sandramycini]
MKILLALALLGASTGTPAVAAPDAGAIRWHQCALDAHDEEGAALDAAGAECGDLDVPLDYGRPNGRKITVALSRVKARGERIGALVINNGGPGGPSLAAPIERPEVMAVVGQHYDLIGLDPRSVGRSTPVDCKLPFAAWPWGAGSTRASYARSVAIQADVAQRCTAEAGSMLPYINTRNTARDLDRVRSALGERKISYLGYSYGSYLGAVYLQLFPGRTDRVVLDGPVDPNTYGPRLVRQVGPANEDNLRAWATWAAARNSTYGLGTTQRQVLAKIDRLYRHVATHELEIGKHRVGEGLLPILLWASLNDDRDQSRGEAAVIINNLVKAVDGPVEPDANLGGFLDAVLSPAMSQLISAQTAIACGDRAAPRDPQVYWRDIQAHRATEPHFGALTRGISPCAFWPVAPQEPPTRIANAERALIVAAENDPRTLYANAAVLRQGISGSRVLTLQGARKHGVFGEYGNACADGKVIAYLKSGVLPVHDQTCAQ